jgi:cytosine deaminase
VVSRTRTAPRLESSPELQALEGIRVANVADRETPVDLDIEDGVIGAIRPASEIETRRRVLNVEGAAVVPGFVDAHVHLDKAYLLGRLEAAGLPYRTVREAMDATSALRRTFTRDDMVERAERCLDQLCANGVCAARVHVEVEPALGLLGVEVHLELRQAWAPLIDLQLVAFPQNGLAAAPGTLDLLDEAMRLGCDVVGGCPYADEDQGSHISRVFEVAERWGAPVDFHIDFSDDPAEHMVDAVVQQTVARGFGGKVTVGHLTSLGAMSHGEADLRADLLAGADIHVVSLPATDVFLGGRSGPVDRPGALTPIGRLAARGVNVSLGTNNTQNAFTPLGRPSPLSVAWLAGLAGHLGERADRRWLMDAVTTNPARILGRSDWGLHTGAPAELAILDTRDADTAVASASSVLGAVHAGRLRPTTRPQLVYTDGSGDIPSPFT